MVQSVARALELLELLKQASHPMSIAELSTASCLQPSTAHRLLQTLCTYNFVYKDDSTHLYQLGSALISLGNIAVQEQDLGKMSIPFLKQLSHLTGEDAYLMIISGYNGLVISRVDGPNDLRVVEKFGFEVELHCGGIRKTLLAHQSPEFIEEYIQHCASTPLIHPLKDPAALRLELKTIQKNGYGITTNDYVQHATGIGAPIFGPDGKLVASLGIIAPAIRAHGHEEDLINQVRTQADGLSQVLGYTPSRF